MLRRALVAVLAALAVGAATVAAGSDGPAPEFASDRVITSAPATSVATAPPTTDAPPTTVTTAAAVSRPRTTAAPRPATTRPPVASPAPAHLATGVVAAFYYGWYPANFTGAGTHFHPTGAPYDSKDPGIVKNHIAQMRYGGITAGIASWWGPGSTTDAAFPADLAAAEGTPFKWAILYEPEGPGFANQSADQLHASLQYIVDHYTNHANYLRVDGRPVIFVWPDPNDRCDMLARWKQANTFGLHVVEKRFVGYTACEDQTQSWYEYSPDHYRIEVKPWSISIGPGFWKYDEASPRLGRDPAAFESAARALAASPAMWKLVTTFNEWGEGTAIEPAAEWATPSGHGTYLEILHNVLGSR